MTNNLLNLIPFSPYLLIIILVIRSFFKKEKFINSAILSICFSSIIFIFLTHKSYFISNPNFAIGLNVVIYASIAITIPLSIAGWVIGKKSSFTKTIVIGMIALLCNFSVLQMYMHVLNKNKNLLNQEAKIDCQKLAFHCAIKNNQLDKILELKKSGHDIEARDTLSHTPLWYAINNKNAVKILLENGANPDSFNIYGETPLAYSLVISLTPNLEIAQLLINHGADINRTVGFRKKISILNFAIVNNNINAINFALSNGAITDTPDDYKKTPCQRLKTFAKNQIKNIEKYCPN